MRNRSRTTQLDPTDQDLPLSMAPLIIVGLQEPVEGGDGGINADMLASGSRLLCGIAPYGPPIVEGDKLDIYWGTNHVNTRFVMAAEAGTRKPLYFNQPIDHIVPGWIDPVYYVLTRFGETVPDPPANSLRVLVKVSLPGGRDSSPGLPGHSNLYPVQLPQDIIDNGVVDAEWARKGVPMTVPRYENITKNDVINVTWGSIRLQPHTVTEEEATGLRPIVITATQDDILAGGDSSSLLVFYRPHDEVWNYSTKRSQSVTVKVDAGAWQLEAPIILEAVNGVIDLDALNKQPVTVQLLILPPHAVADDSVTMTWIGTPPQGKPLIYTQSRLVSKVPDILEIPVPYEQVRAIAGGTVEVAFVLYKDDGGPPVSSKRTFASVVGNVSLLPEPQIREALGDTLEPDVPHATVDIEYLSITNGDLVTMKWLGTQSDGTPYLYEEEHLVTERDADAGMITLYVGPEHIARLDYGRLEVSYEVYNDAQAVYGISSSEILVLHVGHVLATLPVPRVIEADPPDVLDPSKIFEIATLHVPYVGTVARDTLYYRWDAPTELTSTNGSTPITTGIAGKPVNFRIDREFVASNIGTYVNVRYFLKHDSTQRYSYSATLKLLIGFLVGELPPPRVIQAPTNQLDPMNALGGVDIDVTYASMDPAFDTVVLKWIGTPGDGTSDDLELPGHSSGSVQFHLPSKFVANNLDRDVVVLYNVIRYGLTTPSQTLNLKVLNFQDPDTQLPTPRVPQAFNDVLDLMNFTGNPNVTVVPWPHIEVGQRVWLSLIGETTAGATYPIVLLAGTPISQVSTGLNEVLPRSEVMKLGHSSKATLVCKVTFDKSSDEFAAVTFPSKVLTIKTRYDYITPEIKEVTDAAGSVPDNDLTRYVNVTVSGTATREETVELFDAAMGSLGTALVAVNGIWQRQLGPLAERSYRITAKALYDAVPNTGQPRTFVVELGVAPLISRVTDSLGPVAPGGTTYDTSITVQGIASAGEKIQLLNGATVLYTVDVDPSGKWQQLVSNLTPTTYNLIAKALYHVVPVSSPPHPVIVAQLVIPTIASVSDVRGEVPQGGTTFYQTVTVRGLASRNEQIELRDGTDLVATVNVVGTGEWSYNYSNLQMKPYSLTAKALYGSRPVSTPARTFTVAAHISPTLTNVVDSGGTVPPGGFTYDTSVTVSGDAAPGERVEIFNGSTSLGIVPVNANRQWSLLLNNLTVSTYRLTAKALYNVTPDVSPPRAFTVEAHVTPRLTSVRDSGGEVSAGSTTYDRTVTVSGTASKNKRIELRDGNTLVATVNVSASGAWSYSYNNLQSKTYSLTAKGLYASQPISTPPWTFTVAAHIAPTLTQVTDSSGTVPPNGTTYDRVVDVRGEGSPGYQVQIFNGVTSLGVAPINTSGVWQLRLNNLTTTTYTLTAKALYNVTPDTSPPRSFTVGTAIAPRLTSVRDSKGELANNGTTTDTLVFLLGEVTQNQEVQIFDGSVGKHIVRAVGTAWNTTLVVGLGAHVITARAVSTGQVSNSRSFTVISSFNFNTAPVTLSGKIYLIPGNPNILPAFGSGTSVRHVASGGTPPYSYTSSNTAVAVVDAGGLVTVRGRGAASITGRDSAGQSRSYTVNVTGVIHLIGVGRNTWPQTVTRVGQIGARLPSMGEMREIHSVYASRWPMGNDYYWSRDMHSNFIVTRYYMKNMVTGTEAHVQTYAYYLGFGLR